MSTNRFQIAAGATALAIVAACSAPTDTGQFRKVDVSALVVPNGAAAHVVVCKDGPTGTYGFTISGVSGGVTLPFGNAFTLVKDECKDIATGPVGSSLTVQETSLAANTQFVRADIYNVSPAGVQDGVVDAVVGNPTGSLTFGDVGKVVVFVNQTIPTGCTFTKGFYRNHPGAVTAQDGRSLTDTRAILAATPGQPGSVTFGGDNLLLNLYQQLLTALINLNGANGPAAVHTAILAAQAGTGGTGQNITTSLTQDQMSALVDVLSAFNEGNFTGWPHCDDD